MLVRQSKNTFIRVTANYGYIVNQTTRYDRTYNRGGAIFLKHITREPRNVEDIIKDMATVFGDSVSMEELRSDFMDFINDLAHEKFIVLGETEKELDELDKSFSYNDPIPFTATDNYTQESLRDTALVSTQDFMEEEMKKTPVIQNLQFELSSRCNERCIHCYIPNDKKNHGWDMPLEKVKELIDEFSEMGGLSVSLSGGEVLLHKDLPEIIRYCRKKDLKISLLSNLIALDDSLIPVLREANVSLVQVSLYSMNPDIHDTITTVKGSWQKTKDAIEKLIAADIPIQISCPLMKANKDGYVKVLEYARRLKVKCQTDYILMARSDLDTSNLANRLSVEECRGVIRDIVCNDIDYKEKTLTKIPLSEKMLYDKNFCKRPVCGVGFDNCCITVNGDVYPCAGWQGYILGNVYKQSLRDIWNNSERVKFLRSITESSFPECLSCEARDYCSRCLVRNFNESGGDMFALSRHFCKIAFLTKEIVEEEYGPELERRERLLVEKLKRESENNAD